MSPFSSLSNKHATKLPFKTCHVTVCLRNAQLESLPMNPRTWIYYCSRRLTFPSAVGQATRCNPGAASEQGAERQTSARFAIGNTSADHLIFLRYRSSGPPAMLAYYYIKCFICHAYPAISHRHSLSLCYPAGGSPHVSPLSAFWLPPAIAGCSPRALCYWPLSLVAIWPCCPSNAISFTLSNANIPLLTAGRSPHASPLSAIWPSFLLLYLLH